MVIEPLADWTERALERIGSGGPPLLLVGLTGGIGTGKSSVAGMLRELGAPVLDADELVHELLAAGGAAVEPVIGAFGQEVSDGEGGIDRAELGALVFRDDAIRRRLEEIVHPLVIEESRRRFARMAGGGAEIVIYDAALLVETGRHDEFDRLVVVSCDRETQMRRLMGRGDLSADEAGARIRAQMPVEDKVAVADHVVDNSGPWHETRRRVDALYRTLRQEAQALVAALARETGLHRT